METESPDNPVEQARLASQPTPETIPSDIDLELVKQKMAAGLTKEQAVQVLITQAENDRRIAETP